MRLVLVWKSTRNGLRIGLTDRIGTKCLWNSFVLTCPGSDLPEGLAHGMDFSLRSSVSFVEFQ